MIHGSDFPIALDSRTRLLIKCGEVVVWCSKCPMHSSTTWRRLTSEIKIQLFIFVVQTPWCPSVTPSLQQHPSSSYLVNSLLLIALSSSWSLLVPSPLLFSHCALLLPILLIPISRLFLLLTPSFWLVSAWLTGFSLSFHFASHFLPICHFPSSYICSRINMVWGRGKIHSCVLIGCKIPPHPHWLHQGLQILCLWFSASLFLGLGLNYFFSFNYMSRAICSLMPPMIELYLYHTPGISTYV